MEFDWVPQDGGFRAYVSASVTLCVSPDRIKNGKPSKGTTWRAQATHWNERTKTASRYGRDEYCNTQSSAKDAMRVAENIYLSRKSGDDNWK